MGYSENFSNKLNDLLNMNYEVEKIYLEAFKRVTDDDALKIFFKERQIKRNAFSLELRNEIAKHNIVPKSVSVLRKYYHTNQMNNSSKDIFNEEDSLSILVFRLIRVSIDGYNEFLREMSLPLSLCKILIKQRDDLQDVKRIFERDNEFSA